MRSSQKFSPTQLWAPLMAALIWGLWAVTTGCGSGGSDPSTSPTPNPNRPVRVFSVTPSTVSAAGGQTVTITGEGFLARTNTQLRFPGGLNNARVISETEIRGTTVPTNFSSNPFTDVVVVIADGISSADHSPTQVYVSVQK
jgi:hypothetical protein